jgi:hypothetical protein
MITSRQQRNIVATAAYDRDKLVTLATKIYTKDFTSDELSKLPWQCTVYISHMCRDERFKNSKNLRELSVKLVETKKNNIMLFTSFLS